MGSKILLTGFMSVSLFIICDAYLPMNSRPAPKPRSNGPIVNGELQQIVDHSNNDSIEYWTQRYFSNNEFVRSDDHPIFLLIDGEYTSDAGWLHGGQWNNWAKKYGAMMYQLEHRFFGESLPRPDLSINNLKLLTTDNALADIRYFITKMNEENHYSSENKWILFGGSYPGVLVAWSRLNSPDLVTGAISSSAPVEAMTGFPDFFEKGVPFGLDFFSPGCADSVHQAILAIQDLLDKNDVDTLGSKIPICSTDPTNWLDRALFFSDIMSYLANLVQMYRPWVPTDSISYACDTYLNNPEIEQPIDRLSAYLSFKGASCSNAYTGQITVLRRTNYDPNVIARQWLYLMCHEFGWFMTSSDKSSLASDTIPLAFFIKQCEDGFGPEYTQEALQNQNDYLNSLHQGTDISTTNIVFIQGNLDPYRYAGIIENPSDDMPYILINGTSHTYDIFDSRRDDPPMLTYARSVAESSIGKWLSQE